MCHCILIRYTDTATSDNWQTDTRAYTRPILNTSLSVTDYRVYWKCFWLVAANMFLAQLMSICIKCILDPSCPPVGLFVFNKCNFLPEAFILCCLRIIPDFPALLANIERVWLQAAKTQILRKFEEIKIQTVLQFIFPVPVFIFAQNINFWKLTSTLRF